MININEYLINKQTKEKRYYPKNRIELREIISEKTKKEGLECDLNDIDVSRIKDMSYMFYNSKFNRDISKWNVSKVKDMNNMFWKCPLEKNLPKWYHD